MNKPIADNMTWRGRKRSAAQPLTGTHRARASMYSDTTRFMRSPGSPKSAAICGKAVITAVLSSSSMNKAAPMITGTLGLCTWPASKAGWAVKTAPRQVGECP